MINVVCRPVANNSAIKTNDGEFWFGTHRGIAVVNPEKAYINRCLPPVVIKEAIFNYESISLEAPGKSFTGITPSEFLKEHQAANNNKKPAPKPRG